MPIPYFVGPTKRCVCVYNFYCMLPPPLLQIQTFLSRRTWTTRSACLHHRPPPRRRRRPQTTCHPTPNGCCYKLKTNNSIIIIIIIIIILRPQHRPQMVLCPCSTPSNTLRNWMWPVWLHRTTIIRVVQQATAVTITSITTTAISETGAEAAALVVPSSPLSLRLLQLVWKFDEGTLIHQYFHEVPTTFSLLTWEIFLSSAKFVRVAFSKIILLKHIAYTFLATATALIPSPLNLGKYLGHLDHSKESVSTYYYKSMVLALVIPDEQMTHKT